MKIDIIEIEGMTKVRETIKYERRRIENRMSRRKKVETTHDEKIGKTCMDM